MKYIGQIGLISLIGLIGVVFAWSEPTANPPNDNVAAPLNVGEGRQTKAGDITLNNLKATSITLGEDTRFAWPGGGGVNGAACAWEGVRCYCTDDGSTFADINLMSYTTCSQGVLTDFRNSIRITSGSTNCPNQAPAVCTAGYAHD